MIITNGKYNLNESLIGQISKNLTFELGKKYYLYGENGSGKTSFIINVLIPELLKNQNNNFLIFFASQDFTIQYYAIKSYYKGLKKIANDLSSIEKTLLFIKDEYFKLGIPVFYILDEIDQHTEIFKFIENINNKNSIILTSHNIIDKIDNKFTKIFFKSKSEHLTNIYEI